MNNWTYQGEEIEELEDFPSGSFGFIYRVTHEPTGKKYLGRKQLVYSQKRKIGKKETERLKQEKKEAGESGWWNVPEYKYVDRESDWKEYHGSADEIQELIESGSTDDFNREILDIAYHKKQLNYKEVKLLFEQNVLEDDSYINNNILGKYYPKDALDEIQ